RSKSRNHFVEQLDDAIGFTADGELLQFGNLLDQRFQLGNPARLHAQNFFYLRRYQRFIHRHQFFTQFLAGSKPDERNRNFLFWNKAGKANQVPGHIDEFDLLSHLKHKDLSASGQSGGLKYQKDRLGNRHKVTGDFRMGHRNRPALLDLLQEQRHDAAITAQDVTEADG